ncbi:MAG: hypothetical protein ACTS4Y_01445 [Candidatus Hodgkinia cicadicola]
MGLTSLPPRRPPFIFARTCSHFNHMSAVLISFGFHHSRRTWCLRHNDYFVNSNGAIDGSSM